MPTIHLMLSRASPSSSTIHSPKTSKSWIQCCIFIFVKQKPVISPSYDQDGSMEGSGGRPPPPTHTLLEDPKYYKAEKNVIHIWVNVTRLVLTVTRTPPPTHPFTIIIVICIKVNNQDVYLLQVLVIIP